MKKRFVYSLIFICSQTLLAQRGLEIGPRVFPHFTSLVNPQDKQSWDKNIRSTALDWGIELGYSTRMTRSVRSGIYFAESGDAFIRDGNYYARKVNSIEIPMQFKFITDPFYIYMFSFYIGPQIKMKTTAYHSFIEFNNYDEALAYAQSNQAIKKPDASTELNYLHEYGINFWNTEYLYRKYTLDLTFGLGFDYPLNSFILFTSYFKYDYSIFNVENKNYEIKFKRFWSGYWTPSYERSRTRNVDFGFMFGLTLILPKRR